RVGPPRFYLPAHVVATLRPRSIGGLRADAAAGVRRGADPKLRPSKPGETAAAMGVPIWRDCPEWVRPLAGRTRHHARTRPWRGAGRARATSGWSTAGPVSRRGRRRRRPRLRGRSPPRSTTHLDSVPSLRP